MLPLGRVQLIEAGAQVHLEMDQEPYGGLHELKE